MKVGLSIQQVTNGLEYKGTFELEQKTFDYQLKFGVPINKLDNQSPPNDSEEEMDKFARKMFQFTVTENGIELEITKELFSFMLQLAGQQVILFYNNPQTQDSNEGIIGSLVNHKSELSALLNVQASIGMSCSFTIADEHVPKILKE